MKLPVVKPRRFENSDAGPGVGVSNFEVRFGDAELSSLYERDYTCRVQSARDIQGTMKQRERTVLLVTAFLMVLRYSGINIPSFII